MGLNDDGVVTLEEFLYALEGAGVHIGHEINRARVDVGEEEAARLLSYFDRDGQGVLRYNEFMRLLQGTIEIAQPSVPMWRGSTEDPRGGTRVNESRGTQDNAALSGTGLIREAIGVGHGGRNEDMQRIQAAFQHWDQNRDGKISEAEILQVFQQLDPRITGKAVRKMLAHADTDGDGAINYQEFIAWLFR